jgi:hypothetical protein
MALLSFMSEPLIRTPIVSCLVMPSLSSHLVMCCRSCMYPLASGRVCEPTLARPCKHCPPHDLQAPFFASRFSRPRTPRQVVAHHGQHGKWVALSAVRLPIAPRPADPPDLSRSRTQTSLGTDPVSLFLSAVFVTVIPVIDDVS